jgi:23S rRNA pseudouridine2605 synthase
MSDDNEENDGRPARSDDRVARDRQAPAAPSEAGERISKVISRAGVASRRDVERMIGEGRITLNGETLTTPVVLVKPSDRILVDGAPLPMRERTRLFVYHKPRGLVTTEKDPEGRATVFEALPEGLPRLVSIGRLDLNTEGLLLLTNDGGLARVLAHPKTGWLRRYRARAFGEITQDQLDGLKHGIEIDGMHYGPVEAKVDREQGSNMWLTLGLREGKNREVKRILEHFGLKVNRLIRVSFGPFQLGELASGAVEEVRARTLRDQLGAELAREAKLDLSGDAQGPRRPERDLRRQAHRGERRDREAREHGFFDRYPSRANAEERRASRKAEAVAQSRRSGAHRHSWRDAESWAVRGARRKDLTGAKRPARPPHDGMPSKPDDRPHFRGGRIADRKGRSIRVERVARDPAAAPRGVREHGEASPASASPGAARAAERISASPRSAGEDFRSSRAPPRGIDVLRRKTRREQGLPSPQRGELREGRSRGESRNERWKTKGGRDVPRDRRGGGHGAGGEAGRPWRGRDNFKTRRERDFDTTPRKDRPAKFKQRGEGPKPSRGDGSGVGSDRKSAGGFRPRGEGFGPRSFGPHRGDSGGFRGGPPKGRGPKGRTPRKPPR